MIIRHPDVLVLFSFNAIKIKSQPINNWLVCTPAYFQAKSPKGKNEHVCVLLQFIAKRSDDLYELFMNHLKY
jgi:hypothetical protein